MRRRESETKTVGINQDRRPDRGGEGDDTEKLKEKYPRGLLCL